MTSKNVEQAELCDKPFPWRCPECGKREVRAAIVHHTSEIRHDGQLYSVEIPHLRVPRCDACGEIVFDNDADAQIARAFREQLALLSSDLIRRNREQLGLSQRDLAQQLGVPLETIAHWEDGTLIQSRAMDRYLRVYFGMPAVRAALVERAALPSFGAFVEQ